MRIREEFQLMRSATAMISRTHGRLRLSFCEEDSPGRAWDGAFSLRAGEPIGDAIVGVDAAGEIEDPLRRAGSELSMALIE